MTSRLGEGSTFWFTVPACATTWDACGSASVHPDLAGLSVLVVDDNASQRAVLSEHLVGWGMAVTAVDGGQTALAAMQDAQLQMGRPLPLLFSIGACRVWVESSSRT